MNEYAVDVVIAVHSAERPVARAVASVLNSTKAPVRVTVVAHNIGIEVIREGLGAFAQHPQLRLVHLNDGIRSPAGPMNLGLELAEASFVSLLGSDDELAPGAIDSWLELQRRTGAEAVLARIVLASGKLDPYPPVRWGRRTRELNGLKDRLAYRSAPLGMMARARFSELRLTAGVGSGEDLAYSLTVWFTGAHLAYDLRGPAYIVNGDAGDRVTSDIRPLSQEFAFLDHLEALAWFQEADQRTRVSIVVKLFRMHVVDAVRLRSNSSSLLAEARLEFRHIIVRLERLAPTARKVLSRADSRLWGSLSDTDTPIDAATFHQLITERDNFGSPAAVLTRDPRFWFHPQAPFRTLLGGLLVQKLM